MTVSQPPFQRFLDAHRDDVWRFLVASVGRDAADDCFQETFLAAMRAYPRMRPDNPRAWVLTIAHRKALDHFRARKRRAVPVGDDLPDVAAPPDPEPRDDGVWARVRALPAQAARRACCCASPATSATARSRRRWAVGGGRAPQRLRGTAQAATGDDRMTEDRLAPPTFDPADAAAAAARFAATAPADVAYALVDSPVGTLVAAATARGLATLSYEDHHGGADAVLDRLAAKLSPADPRGARAPGRRAPRARRVLRGAPARLRPAHRLVAHDARSAGACCRPPPRSRSARVSTYGEMAAQAGNAKASRAAGRALGANPIPIVVPCHRVLGAGGRLAGYTGGLHRKVALLEIEGVVLPG